MSTILTEPTDEALERICDAHWNSGGEGVKFRDIHQHNACNHTLSGTIEIDGTEYGFIIQNGDWNGTVVDKWGLADDVGTYKPEPPTLFTFVPMDDTLRTSKPHMWQVYLAWRKEKWFQDKERAYNYDRHFQPGGAIENHYREWAAKKGMKPGIFEP